MKASKNVVAGAVAATLFTTAFVAAPAQAAAYTYVSVLTPSRYTGTKIFDRANTVIHVCDRHSTWSQRWNISH